MWTRGGLGLGAQQIGFAHVGTIRVELNQEHGTRFILELPIRKQCIMLFSPQSCAEIAQHCVETAQLVTRQIDQHVIRGKRIPNEARPHRAVSSPRLALPLLLGRTFRREEA